MSVDVYDAMDEALDKVDWRWVESLFTLNGWKWYGDFKPEASDLRQAAWSLCAACEREGLTWSSSGRLTVIRAAWPGSRLAFHVSVTLL